MFLWSARTLANALREHLPKTAPLLEEIAGSFRHAQVCGNFSQAISQVRKHQHRLCGAGAAFGQGREAEKIFCLPADFGWNDLGSWTALHEHHTAKSTSG